MCKFVNNTCIICGLEEYGYNQAQLVMQRQIKAIRRTAELGILITKAIGMTLDKEFERQVKRFIG